jgi:Peptidoglycan-binding protein, CsiV
MPLSYEEITMRIAILLLFGFGLLSTLPAGAAPADKESTYEIEIVVFENRLPDLIGDEMLARDAEARVKKLETAVTPEAAVSEPYLHPTITSLLDRDGHYRVLAHQHWQQTIDAKTVAKPVRVVAANPAELEGTIRFFMSRHLHLDVDLLFRDITAGSGNVSYRLSEQRKLKSQETHYFDHPRLGVLVRVMPLDLEKGKGKL